MKDHAYAKEREAAQQELRDFKPGFVNQRLENCCKKPGQREADYADGDIGIFDAPVEKHPVSGNEQTGRGNTQLFFKSKPGA